MHYFYNIDTSNIRILHASTGEADASMLPKFYAGNWEISVIPRTEKSQSLKVVDDLEYAYIIFSDQTDLIERIETYNTIYPDMELVKICEPRLVDIILRRLNSRNRNEYIEIWQTNYVSE